MQTDSLIERIRVIAQSQVEELGLELVHVELSGSKRSRIVRIYIDKEGGVDHDDCALVSQRVESVLDQEDPVPGSYVLEISSPGIERGLYSLEDFERFCGEIAKVRTYEAIEGQRNFRGTIAGITGDSVVIEDVTSGEVGIPLAIVKKANLEVDIAEELKRSRTGKKKRRAR